jgi:hypothetical protein
MSPGTAYPIERRELNLCTKALGLYLIEKLINKAKPAQIIPVTKDKLNVLIELEINF